MQKFLFRNYLVQKLSRCKIIGFNKGLSFVKTKTTLRTGSISLVLLVQNNRWFYYVPCRSILNLLWCLATADKVIEAYIIVKLPRPVNEYIKSWPQKILETLSHSVSSFSI